MSESSDEIEGGCLCGAVRFAIRKALRNVIACHCGQCRRTHGHFAAYTAAPRTAVRWIERGGLAWYASSAHARRGFCEHCGSSLFWDLRGDAALRIAAGALAGATGLRTVCHVHTADKGDYYEIGDRVEQLAGSGLAG